jgi:hypothetical protein
MFHVVNYTPHKITPIFQTKMKDLTLMKHEDFRVSPMYPFLWYDHEKNMNDYSEYTNPGFFFTFDEHGNYTRCGVVKNIKEELLNKTPNPKDVFCCIGVSRYDGDFGFKTMKSFKQQFKRCIKYK